MMLERIVPKPLAEKKVSFKEMRCISAYVKPSTHAFMVAEAEARNMPLARFVKEIFERLESGEF